VLPGRLISHYRTWVKLTNAVLAVSGKAVHVASWCRNVDTDCCCWIRPGWWHDSWHICTNAHTYTQLQEAQENSVVDDCWSKLGRITFPVTLPTSFHGSFTGVDHVNKVTLRWARLVLRWVTADILSVYVMIHSGQLSFLHSAGWEINAGHEGSGNEARHITDCGLSTYRLSGFTKGYKHPVCFSVRVWRHSSRSSLVAC